MAERYLERMALKLVTSGFKVGRLSKEQNVRIRYVPCKRINNMNGGSLFYRLELFSLCSSDGIMPMPCQTGVQYSMKWQITAM